MIKTKDLDKLEEAEKEAELGTSADDIHLPEVVHESPACKALLTEFDEIKIYEKEGD